MAWPFDEVLLARHGETEWNVEGRRQGQLDSPLTERGRRQAVVVAALAVDARPDAVFSSALGRAQTTAEKAAGPLGMPVRVRAELNEVHHGDVAGHTSAEIERRWPGALAEREADKYRWRFPGGESYEDAAGRVVLALDAIAATGSTRPLLVAHEMIGRMVIGRLLGLAPDDALGRRLTHGTILRIDPTAGRTTVLEPAG